MTKQIPSARHQAALPVNASTTGFAGELAYRCGVYLGKERFVPDAFRFELHRKTLRLFEVIVTHPLTAEKMWRIRLLRDVMGSQGWRLRLVACSPGGGYRNVDMETGEPILTHRELSAAIDCLPICRRYAP